jgi:hypothetical protein
MRSMLTARNCRTLLFATGSLGLAGFARASDTSIALDDQIVLAPGGSGSALVTLSTDGSAPHFFGYSLALLIVPDAGALGSASFDLEDLIDESRTNLATDWNLIAAYPAPLDPFFTVVWPDGPNGVFINANIDLFDPRAPDFVTIVPGVNDVLAEIVVDASADASGTFSIVVGPATGLSDPNGFSIPYVWTVGKIVIDVTPPTSPDLDGDGSVGASDLAILLGDWGPCPTLPPDLSGDGFVDSTDLAIFLGAWGSSGGPADFNGDGVVGPQDLGNLLGEWGSQSPPCGDLDEDGVVTAADLAILLGAWTGI